MSESFKSNSIVILVKYLSPTQVSSVDDQSIKGFTEHNYFLNYYNKACELYVPKIDISGEIRLKEKWLTRGMKINMRKRLNLWHANQRAK